MRAFIASVFILVLFGCGSQVKLKATPVNVSGKVSQRGQPFGGMTMIFQPLGDGHVREFSIHKNGNFDGELVSGEYAYYVSKATARSAAPSPKKLSPKYFEADLSRTVTVGPDKQLAIALD